MYENTLSAADVAAVTRNNDSNGNGMFGNDAWWIIILLLFGYNGRGFGFGGGFGGNCGSPCATQADLSAAFASNATLNGINGIDSALCQGFNGIQQSLMSGFAGVDRSVCTLGYNQAQLVNGLSRELADCCCGTKQAIADVKYTIGNEACETRHALYNSTRDIIDNANANSRAILDFLTQDKIATLTAENQSLKFAASQSAQNAFITANQEAQTAELIRRLGRDCPVPAYVVPNPNCCYNYAVQPACNTCGSGF